MGMTGTSIEVGRAVPKHRVRAGPAEPVNARVAAVWLPVLPGRLAFSRLSLREVV